MGAALAIVGGACSFDTSGVGGDGREPDARGTALDDANAPDDADAPDDAAASPDARDLGDADIPDDWWDPSLAYRVEISIDVPGIDEDLEDVPVLVILDDDRIDYDLLREDGGDLRAVSDDGDELPVEIEHFEPGARSFLWVRVKQVGDGAGFWLYFGHPDADGNDRLSDVWREDYLAVWHLADDGALHVDSTGNGHDGAPGGSERVGPETGAIGGAQEFDGSSHIEVATDAFPSVGDELTMLVRARTFEPEVDFPHVVGAGGDGRFWQIWFRGPSDAWGGRYRAGGTQTAVFGEVGAVDAWQVVALVYDGEDVRLYVDGELAPPSPQNQSGDLDELDSPLLIGDNPELSPRGFLGYIDEVRIARAARSADWIRVQHLSLSDELLSLGEVEALADGAAARATRP